MNGLFGNSGGMNTGQQPSSPFAAATGNGASTWQAGWGKPASLPSHMVTTASDILGGGAPPVPLEGPPSPVNDQRNAITQTLANLTMPATPAAPATSAGPPAGGQSMASVTLPQQSVPDAGAYAQSGTNAQNILSGLLGGGNQQHNLDPMGGGTMPPDFQRGPAIASTEGGAGK